VAGYSLRIKPSAAKEVEAIEPRKLRRQIVERIRQLAADPRPRGCEKLAGGSGRYRLRQGAYRIVYSVVDDEHLVVVFKVGHRSEVYRDR
jgi:mRNA interferase RelE/StbE